MASSGFAIMLEKIICGQKTGVDQAARRAAKAFGVPVGMPTHTEPARTEQNVEDSDGTLWFGETTTALAQSTVAACQKLGKPCLPVYPAASFEPSHVASWIAEGQIKTLNVAGNLEPAEPGIGARVEQFLGKVLEWLGHEPV
jgi:hypothetical protein